MQNKKKNVFIPVLLFPTKWTKLVVVKTERTFVQERVIKNDEELLKSTKFMMKMNKPKLVMLLNFLKAVLLQKQSICILSKVVKPAAAQE